MKGMVKFMDNLRKSFLVRGNSIVGFSDKNFSTCPLGTVLSYAGNIIPRGFLACDGASYKVSDYPDLYAVIGNTYGGDTENFNVPTVQPPALTMVYIIKAFHTNEGVDSGVSDDVIEYVNDSLMDKADKSYVDDNFATMDKVAEDTKTANGKVIKFPNGTMIQSGVKTVQSDSYVPFDVTFVNKNYTLIISSSSNSRDISVGNKFEAGFGVVNGSNVTVNYIAVGSWK